jgi:circadian clock protein KaiB
MDEIRSRLPEEAGTEARPLTGTPAAWYILRLYVTGGTLSSLRAIAKVRAVCDELLAGRYQLQVIDIYQQPALAAGDQITVAPTLVRRAPGPLRKLMGDLSDRERILAGLELQAAAGG